MLVLPVGSFFDEIATMLHFCLFVCWVIYFLAQNENKQVVS